METEGTEDQKRDSTLLQKDLMKSVPPARIELNPMVMIKRMAETMVRTRVRVVIMMDPVGDGVDPEDSSEGSSGDEMITGRVVGADLTLRVVRVERMTGRPVVMIIMLLMVEMKEIRVIIVGTDPVAIDPDVNQMKTAETEVIIERVVEIGRGEERVVIGVDPGSEEGVAGDPPEVTGGVQVKRLPEERVRGLEKVEINHPNNR